MSNSSACRRIQLNAKLMSTVSLQCGVISFEQLAESGLDHDRIALLEAQGSLERLRRGVYRHTAHKETRTQAIVASSLAVGADAIISSHTAAEVWALRGIARERQVHVAIPRGRTSKRKGVVVHSARDYFDLETLTLHGVRIESPFQSVMSFVTSKGRQWLLLEVDRLLGEGHTSIDALQSSLAFHRQRQTRYLDLAEGVLIDRMGRNSLENALEDKVVRWITSSNVAKPKLQHTVTARSSRAKYQLDIAYPEFKIAIEIDGFASHRDPIRFDSDRVRNNELTTDGWVVLHVTASTNRNEFLALLAKLIDSRSNGLRLKLGS